MSNFSTLISQKNVCSFSDQQFYWLAPFSLCLFLQAEHTSTSQHVKNIFNEIQRPNENH